MSGQLVKTIDVLRDQFVNAPTALKICECPMSFIGGSRPIQRMPSRKDTDFLILGRNLTLKIRKIKRPYPPRECVFPSVGNHHWRDSAPLWALSLQCSRVKRSRPLQQVVNSARKALMLSWTFWRLLDLEPVDPVASPRDKVFIPLAAGLLL